MKQNEVDEKLEKFRKSKQLEGYIVSFGGALTTAMIIGVASLVAMTPDRFCHPALRGLVVYVVALFAGTMMMLLMKKVTEYKKYDLE